MQSKGKNNKFTKGKKSKKFTNPKSEKQIEKDSRTEGRNDVSWYGDTNFISAAARLNFTNPLGKTIGYGFYPDPNGATTVMDNNGISVLPGIMSFGVLSTPGFCQYASDTANIYIRNFYSWIRHQNSGHANYDAPDLAMYMFAINEIHAMVEHLIRVYGVARTASSANRYLPSAELTALGVLPDSYLYDNLADFRARLLALMVKAGTFVVPKDIKYNERHREMFKYVYADGETAKASLYLFYPQYYRVYNEVAGKLVTKACPMGQNIFSWLAALEEMIEALISSESMNIMSGDILKAYGPENIYRMEYFGEDYTVLPVYNSEILLEIHNAKIAGPLYQVSAGDIAQDTNLGILTCTPYFEQSVPTGEIYPLIDMPIQDPTPEQVMIGTRLCHTGGLGYISTDSKWKYVPYTLGSEIITHCTVYRINGNNIEATSMGEGMDAGATIWSKVLRYTNFDWHPPIYFVAPDTANNRVGFKGVDAQMENYTVVDAATLDKINEYALIGLFRVPLMGTWQTDFKR